MPNHRVLLHTNGPALWPEHKPLPEILELKATTPELVWSGTYQGVPTPPGGHIFKRAWWRKPGRRFDHRQPPEVWGRYISWDTGLKDKEESDYSAYVVMDILADYMLTLRHVGMERLEFPDLPERILRVAEQWNADDKLNAVIIEDKNSGTSALQTLRATAPDWLAQLLAEFLPSTDKVTRAGQAQEGSVEVKGENGKLWDNWRGKGSHMEALENYIRAAGENPDFLPQFMQTQANDFGN